MWLPRLAVVMILGGLYYFLAFLGWLPSNPFDWLLGIGEQVRMALPQYGPLAPFVYIVFYAGQIVIAPLPGAALSYTAGYLFGSFWAAVYSMAGILIGSAIGFTAARRLGWPLVEKLAPSRWIERWRNLSAVNSSFTWFLLMLAPTADIFYFIAGLTTLSLRRFMLIVFLGRMPGIVLSSYLGANLETFGAQWIAILIAIMLLIALIGNWVRQQIERRVLVSVRQEVKTD